MMKIDVLSLFPEMFAGVFGHSILKKAAERMLLSAIKLSIFVSMLIINIEQSMIILMVAVQGWF